MGKEESTPAPSVSGSQKRRRRKLFALSLGLLPFLLLETGLRLAGVGAEPTDLHAGFGNVAPLFELQEDNGVRRTSLAKEQFFVAQEFPEKKPEDEFRIFCLGGSTVQGRPYAPETSFGTWLELELNAVDTAHRYRSINCGGVSYASYRLRPVLSEVLQYEPDLIVLATGHNEFLEDRTYSNVKSRSGIRIWLENQAKSLRTVMLIRKLVGGAPRVEPTADTSTLSEGVEARLDKDDGYASYRRDSQWHDQVAAQFHDSVAEMLEMCHDANVKVVLVRLGANLRDCPPFKSEHRADLSVEDEQNWQRLFDEGTRVGVKDPEDALKLYREALDIDDQYPLLHFRIARCLDQLKRYDEAAVSYRNALNQDICPLRIVERMSDDLTTLAVEHSVPVVDAAADVAQLSPDAIPGYESYIDHVHPTIGVHQRISRAIVETLKIAGWINGKELSIQERRQVYAQHVAELKPAYYSNGRRRIGWLEGWARRQRLSDEILPVDTRGYIATAVRNLDLHAFDLASDHIQMAITTDPAAAQLILDHAATLFGQGRSTESSWVLGQLQIGSLEPKLKAEVHLAELILAVEKNDKSRIEKAFTVHAEEWPSIMDGATTSWAKQMPDVLQRIPR